MARTADKEITSERAEDHTLPESPAPVHTMFPKNGNNPNIFQENQFS